jgi:hypothetical protein
MALATDAGGREVQLLGVAELKARFDWHLSIVAALVGSGYFPEPVHLQPPLWKAGDVERWRKRASVAG